ncbi:MAG: iron transporter [Candidatus Parcubacteria bacterium]|nr:MAG: iron transporter [Candidatus Parcubacteria bacterium]
MYYIQETCARIALATKKGLIFLIKNLYGFKVSFFISILMFLAATFNLAADINAISMLFNYLFPYIPFPIYSLLISIVMCLIIIILPYKKFSNFIKFLAIFLFAYIGLIFVIQVDWMEVFKNIILPEFKINREWLLIFIAILGTTISPYLFFWQEEEELEEIEDNKNSNNNPPNLNIIRIDTFLGMFISNLIMFFIILSSGLILHPLEIYNIEKIDDLIRVFEPLVGKYAFLLFSLGIISSGLIIIPVLAGTCGYILAELFDKPATLNKKFNEAIYFYFFMIFSILLSNTFNFLGLSPIKLLFYTAVIYGILSPLLIFFILKISNNEDLMGEYKNKFISNLFLYFNLIIMLIVLVFYLIL